MADLDETFRRLAIAAGAEILAIYRSGDMDVERKGDDSPVTAADLAADAVICAGLAEAFPDIPVVTEETPESHGSGARSGRFILVDPLDGTREFIARRGDFTVNIALVEDGAPTRGVVYAPARGRLFATRGEGGSGGAVEEDFGAAARDGGDVDPGTSGEVRAIRVATPDNAALRVVASKSHRDATTDAFIAAHQVAELTSAGSSLKFCLLAAGEADLYPRFGRTMEWDTAAGHAVLRAAGGHVVDAATLAPLAYGKPGCDNPHFIAYAPDVRFVAFTT